MRTRSADFLWGGFVVLFRRDGRLFFSGMASLVSMGRFRIRVLSGGFLGFAGRAWTGGVWSSQDWAGLRQGLGGYQGLGWIAVSGRNRAGFVGPHDTI